MLGEALLHPIEKTPSQKGIEHRIKQYNKKLESWIFEDNLHRGATSS